MPKVKPLPTDYYTLQGGMGYKTFLDHFRHQAEGVNQPGLVLTSGGNAGYQRCKSKMSRLRLVKLATESAPSEPPKVEVVDPNEAMKNRAVAELKRDLSNNTAVPPNSSQSKTGRRRRDNPTSTSAAKRAVKRALDVFDK